MATEAAAIKLETTSEPPAGVNEKVEPSNVQVAEVPAVSTPKTETAATGVGEKAAETKAESTTEDVVQKVEELKVDGGKEVPKEEAGEEKKETPAPAAVAAAAPVEEKVEATLSGPAPAEPAIVAPAINPIIAAALEKEKETGKKYTIFEHPTASSKPAPSTPLTDAEKEKYAKVLAHFETLSAVPVSSEKGAPVQPLEDHERMFLTQECFERYLRAAKWDVDAAIKRVEATLVWRREYGTDKHTAEYIQPEQETGKQWSLYYDNEGRVCHCLNPARQNTEQSPKQVQHLIYMLERDIELMPAGQSTIALIVDFGQTSREKRTPISTAREVLHILQNHYPERLGKALVINSKSPQVPERHLANHPTVPWFINAFFKIITPFIDPVTRQKLVFNEDLTKYIPAEQLEKRFGGQVDFEYDHAVYWTHLHEVTGKRRAEYVQRWIERGKKVGDSEFILKGGVSA